MGPTRQSDEVEAFFGEFETVRQASSVNAPDFNVFDFIAPDELRLSTILADLMNPRGSHDQGDLFLKGFLGTIEHAGNIELLGSVDGRTCTVVRESPTRADEGGGSLDIEIDFGDIGVGVENKPWAGETKDQLKKYLAHLRRNYPRKHVLVFLSRPNYEIRTLGSDLTPLKRSGEFVHLLYTREMLEWLDGCIARCQSGRVRHFLEDFRVYMQENFGTESEAMEETA